MKVWNKVEEIMQAEDIYGTIVPIGECVTGGITVQYPFWPTDNMNTADRCIFIALCIEEAYKVLWDHIKVYYPRLTEDSGIAEQMTKLFSQLEDMYNHVALFTHEVIEEAGIKHDLLPECVLDKYAGFKKTKTEYSERAHEIMVNVSEGLDYGDVREYATLWRSFQITHHRNMLEWILHLQDVINAHLDKHAELWLNF